MLVVQLVLPRCYNEKKKLFSFIRLLELSAHNRRASPTLALTTSIQGKHLPSNVAHHVLVWCGVLSCRAWDFVVAATTNFQLIPNFRCVSHNAYPPVDNSRSLNCTHQRTPSLLVVVFLSFLVGTLYIQGHALVPSHVVLRCRGSRARQRGHKARLTTRPAPQQRAAMTTQQYNTRVQTTERLVRSRTKRSGHVSADVVVVVCGPANSRTKHQPNQTNRPNVFDTSTLRPMPYQRSLDSCTVLLL